jgi:hypothetical protein
MKRNKLRLGIKTEARENVHRTNRKKTVPVKITSPE